MTEHGSKIEAARTSLDEIHSLDVRKRNTEPNRKRRSELVVKLYQAGVPLRDITHLFNYSCPSRPRQILNRAGFPPAEYRDSTSDVRRHVAASHEQAKDAKAKYVPGDRVQVNIHREAPKRPGTVREIGPMNTGGSRTLTIELDGHGLTRVCASRVSRLKGGVKA